MIDRAKSNDASRFAEEGELTDSLRTQERMRIWRDTAIRVHETILKQAELRRVLGQRHARDAKVVAMPSPSPRLEPVITAVLPLRIPMVASLNYFDKV